MILLGAQAKRERAEVGEREAGSYQGSKAKQAEFPSRGKK